MRRIQDVNSKIIFLNTVIMTLHYSFFVYTSSPLTGLSTQSLFLHPPQSSRVRSTQLIESDCKSLLTNIIGEDVSMQQYKVGNMGMFDINWQFS